MAKGNPVNRAIEPIYQTRLGTAKDRQGREWEIRSAIGRVVTLTRGSGTQSANRDILLSQGWTFHFDQPEAE